MPLVDHTGDDTIDGVVQHNSCALHYRRRGASGPVVLFIQGVGVHGDGWLPQTTALSDAFRCLTFDNRGMGRSQPAGAPITVAQMAEDALAVLDAAGASTAHVVGHSLGGLVALHVAARSPARVRSLSLLCTFPSGREAAPLSWPLLWHGTRSRVGTRTARATAFLQLVLPPGTISSADTMARYATLFGHDLADQPPVASAQLRALRQARTPVDATALAPIPTLVVSARHDPIAPPRAGRAIVRHLPHARYEEVADASHALPISHADTVNTLLRTHWRAVDAHDTRHAAD
jgi:pimeloyl-ACP methyl ester carboxylesterase